MPSQVESLLWYLFSESDKLLVAKLRSNWDYIYRDIVSAHNLWVLNYVIVLNWLNTTHLDRAQLRVHEHRTNYQRGCACTLPVILINRTSLKASDSLSSMVPTNIFQDVPFEIFEYIFDVLAHDDATLSTIKTCSLVSPYFLPLARKHIFASITLNDTSPRKLSPTSLMFEGLISVTPEIANHIHKLDYTVHYHDIAIKGLPSALKKITNLQSLVIKKAQFSARNGKPLKEALLYLLSLPTLSHLSLNSINDFHPSFLKLSIGLKFLETGGIQFASGRGYNNSSVLDPPQLQKYSDCSTESDVLKQLFTARRADGKPIVDFSRLKYLTVTIYETFSEAKALFKQCALVAQLTDVRIYRKNHCFNDNTSHWTISS